MVAVLQNKINLLNDNCEMIARNDSKKGCHWHPLKITLCILLVKCWYYKKPQALVIKPSACGFLLVTYFFNRNNLAVLNS